MINFDKFKDVILDMQEEVYFNLSWVNAHQNMPYVNLGDALSPVVFEMITGYKARWKSFESDSTRFIGVGTIGQNQKNGHIIYCGTGFSKEKYEKPSHTKMDVISLRGPYSAEKLGIDSGIYGDPVIYLPELFKKQGIDLSNVVKKYEVGIVPHISELEELTPFSKPKYKRYDNLGDGACLINTICYPNFSALLSKIKMILSCKFILSVSLHGLILAESFGIPCAWLGFGFKGEREFNVYENIELQDFRIIDYYAGIGSKVYKGIGVDRHLPLFPYIKQIS